MQPPINLGECSQCVDWHTLNNWRNDFFETKKPENRNYFGQTRTVKVSCATGKTWEWKYPLLKDTHVGRCRSCMCWRIWVQQDIYNGCEEVEMNIQVDVSCLRKMKGLWKNSLNYLCVSLNLGRDTTKIKNKLCRTDSSPKGKHVFPEIQRNLPNS